MRYGLTIIRVVGWDAIWSNYNKGGRVGCDMV